MTIILRTAGAARWALVLLITLSGCSLKDQFFGETGPPPLPGQRIAILQSARTVDPSPDLENVAVRLPRPQRNPDWPQAGGAPDHAMHHLDLPETVREVWRSSVGSGSSSSAFLYNSPVMADGRIYAIDAEGNLAALDAGTGRRLWQVDTTPDDDGSAIVAGGVAAAGGKVYVASGYAEVIAYDGATGQQIWRQSTPAPMRAAPTISAERVFVITVENQLIALAAEDGRRLWTHAGVGETAGLLGGASAAVDGNVVLAPFSSGDLFALRLDTGRVVWSESLTAARRIDAVSGLANIRARPVIDRGVVYAMSNAGRFAAISLRTGQRLWDIEVAGTESPWVAGDFIYVLTNSNELICLTRADRKVRWVTRLERFENPEKQRDPINWSGPVLAGDRLIVVGSNSQALSISPYTGELLGLSKLPGKARVAPIVADGTLYILTDDATMIAYR
jgi:outer membrane protein assembly factor BamB